MKKTVIIFGIFMVSLLPVLVAQKASANGSTNGETSGVNVASPSDIRAYEASGWSYDLMMQKPPLPSDTGNNTVLTAEASGTTDQALYLWEEGNMPHTTDYTRNSGSYFDDPDFRPYVTSMLVPKGTEAKGAVPPLRRRGIPVPRRLHGTSSDSRNIEYPWLSVFHCGLPSETVHAGGRCPRPCACCSIRQKECGGLRHRS